MVDVNYLPELVVPLGCSSAFRLLFLVLESAVHSIKAVYPDCALYGKVDLMNEVALSLANLQLLELVESRLVELKELVFVLWIFKRLVVESGIAGVV